MTRSLRLRTAVTIICTYAYSKISKGSATTVTSVPRCSTSTIFYRARAEGLTKRKIYSCYVQLAIFVKATPLIRRTIIRD